LRPPAARAARPINDADWVKPEMKSISGGIFGDGIGSIVAGLLGTHGPTISTANAGLVAATGVASRHIDEPITLTGTFDEFGIDALIAYNGTAIEWPNSPPLHEELLTSDEGLRRMAGFLVRRQADNAFSTIDRGITMLRLNFRH
jgi:hypothetical protein